MTDAGRDPGRDITVNRAAWAQVNAEYTAGHAVQAWQAGEFGWGNYGIPEREMGVLGQVAGLDVIELGCGTAYLSAWLARQGARPVGPDLTHAQLLTARSCQDRFGIWFPLIEADAGQVPLTRSSFDVAVSECGASLYCDPGRWIPEAARLLRPGGRLVFHTLSLLVTMCQPGDRPAGRELIRPQRQARRIRRHRGVEFHPGHGEWISTLRGAGLVVDALHELYARPALPSTPSTRSPAPTGHSAGPSRRSGLPTARLPDADRRFRAAVARVSLARPVARIVLLCAAAATRPGPMVVPFTFCQFARQELVALACIGAPAMRHDLPYADCQRSARAHVSLTAAGLPWARESLSALKLPQARGPQSSRRRRMAGEMFTAVTEGQVRACTGDSCKTVGSAYVGSNPTPATR